MTSDAEIGMLIDAINDMRKHTCERNPHYELDSEYVFWPRRNKKHPVVDINAMVPPTPCELSMSDYTPEGDHICDLVDLSCYECIVKLGLPEYYNSRDEK